MTSVALISRFGLVELSGSRKALVSVSDKRNLKDLAEVSFFPSHYFDAAMCIQAASILVFF